MAGRDITEGRSTRAIAVELGIGTGTLWQNTDVFYDVAIAGVPFLLAEKDQTPYQRATAPFRKQQFDSQRDPGEQSLTGWWLRSQSSFHAGAGIEFFDPFANPYSTTLATNSYRVRDSYGVNLWEPGQVTLLRRSVQNHEVTTPVAANGRPAQGTGGSGGGGAGNGSGVATSGTANTGGGGGAGRGGNTQQYGGNGGSGIVIVVVG